MNRRANVLGVGVHPVNMRSATAAILDAAHGGRKGYVCVSGAHGVIESRKDRVLRRILNRAFLNVPDGMPLVWTGRAQGFKKMGRVYGPDLMINVCRESVSREVSHFLYGGKEGVAEELKEALERRFRGIRIVGTCCPPFTPLAEKETVELAAQVKAAQPDLFWVGLSTPKQERFMAEHLARLETKIMLGVGAAFDLHTGRMTDAPAWVKRSGMQWFHRLCQEPRRLAGRYGVIVPAFLFLIALQASGILKYGIEDNEES